MEPSDSERLERMERMLQTILNRIEPDPMLTEREVASVRRKSVYALRKERARRAGPPWIKDGNAVRYRKSELLEWLRANARETRDSERSPRLPMKALDFNPRE